MSDGIAPALDKVGLSALNVPEAQAKTPLDSALTFGTPNAAEKGQLGSIDPDGHKNVAESAEDDVASDRPKPVEVLSVPETPVNGSTPAGGTPRPELKIADESALDRASSREPAVISGVQEPVHTPTASVPEKEPVTELPVSQAKAQMINGGGDEDATIEAATHNGLGAPLAPTNSSAPRAATPLFGSSSTASEQDAGAKRKLDGAAISNRMEASGSVEEATSLPSDKRVRIGDGNGQANDGAKPRKVGRPRKEKTSAPPVVGRTARKTRNQGPVDA